MGGPVVVRHCLSLEEAHVACAFLRSGGIEAEVDNRFYCSVAPLRVFAIGLGIRVRSEDADDALAALAEVHSGLFVIPDVESLSRTTVARFKTLSLALGAG